MKTIKKQAGFTLVELLVTIAILAILVALAVPSFASSVQRYKVKQSVEAMRSSAMAARVAAIRNGGDVVLHPISGTDWSGGWRLFIDSNKDSAFDTGEKEIQKIEVPLNIVASADAGLESVSFDRWGRPSAELSITFKPNPNPYNIVQTMSLTTSGMVKVN